MIFQDIANKHHNYNFTISTLRPSNLCWSLWQCAACMILTSLHPTSLSAWCRWSAPSYGHGQFGEATVVPRQIFHSLHQPDILCRSVIDRGVAEANGDCKVDLASQANAESPIP